MLGRVLQRKYEVEIVGPTYGDGIWEPIANDKTVSFKPVEISKRSNAYFRTKKLLKNIDGDVIYASKPLYFSFGIGLFKKVIDKRSLILDIDDWERGFFEENSSNLFFLRGIKNIVSFSYLSICFIEKLTKFADEITVSNNFLRNKFGGTIVCHARDTETFNPDKFNKSILRNKYNIKINDKVIMFFGTPRLHKGIEDLIEAISLIEDQDIFLAVVGIDYRDKYCNKLVEIAKKRFNDRLKPFGLQPFKKVPEFLALADVVVIPQKRNFSTIGQIPAKVFDAMAMAKPIIATNVSELPEILEGSGWIVEPDNAQQLADTIQYVFRHPEEAAEMAWKARQKCIEKYSWDKLEEVLMKIFKKYE